MPKRIGIRFGRRPALPEKKRFIFARPDKVLLDIANALRIYIYLHANRFPLAFKKIRRINELGTDEVGAEAGTSGE